MLSKSITIACLSAALSFGQGLVATSPLVSFPAATWGGTGIPNDAVAVSSFQNGGNNLTLAMNATQRYAAPPVTNNGAGTYFATAGPGDAPNFGYAQWNFNFYVQANNTLNPSVSALDLYTFKLFYDMNPASFNDAATLGNFNVTTALNDVAAPVGVIQNSWNLGFGFLRSVPPVNAAPAGYQNPGGIPFDPNALGHYTFSLVAYNGANQEVGRVTIHVSTSGITIPNPTDSYLLRYISNLNIGDSVINITNSGARGASVYAGTTTSTTGTLCANVYAFSPDEQMIGCCSCPVTPNGLVSLSAKNDIISNTLTPAVPTSIVVKLVASIPASGASGCSNSATTVTPLTVTPAANQLTTGMHAWATTIHTGVTANPVITETPFARGTLSVTPGVGLDIGELARLSQSCTQINAIGSGFGICRSCRLGGLGAGRL